MPFEFRLGDVISGGMYLNGEKILDITDAYMPLSANDEMKVDIETSNIRYICDIDSDWSSTMSLTLDNNYDVISQLLDLDKTPDSWNISYPVEIQAKKHRKRRINKKWLKRYGYKTIMRESNGWKLNNYTDGTFELSKSNG